MIPKIIYTCWLSDIDTMPYNIKECISSQLEYHPNYEHIIIDYDKYKSIENELPNWVKHSFEQGDYAHVSDYLRIYFLYKYGGIYLDSDVIGIKNENIFDKYLNYDFFGNIEVSFNYYDVYDILGDQYDHTYFNKPISINESDYYKIFMNDLINHGNLTNKDDLTNFLINNYRLIRNFYYGISIDGAMFGASKNCEVLKDILDTYNSKLFNNYVSDINITSKIHYYPNICHIMAKNFIKYGFNYNVEIGKTYLYNDNKYILFTDRFFSITDYNHRNNDNCELIHYCKGSWRK